MVYVFQMVIFHGYVSHNQMVIISIWCLNMVPFPFNTSYKHDQSWLITPQCRFPTIFWDPQSWMVYFMEHPIEMNDLGVPQVWETSKFGCVNIFLLGMMIVQWNLGLHYFQTKPSENLWNSGTVRTEYWGSKEAMTNFAIGLPQWKLWAQSHGQHWSTIKDHPYL